MKSIARQLNAARVAIDNTLGDAGIQARVAAYGYGPDKMAEGKQLYQQAMSAVNAQRIAAGGYRESTANARRAQATAKRAYQNLGQLARAAFIHHKSHLAALGLTGPMPRTGAGFITAANALFENALKVAEIQKLLADFGYDPDRLQKEQAQIAAFVSAMLAHEVAKGSAQQATRDQDAALEALRNWLAQYIKIARVALYDNKELLEKLGVPVPSGRRSQRKPIEKDQRSDSSEQEQIRNE